MDSRSIFFNRLIIVFFITIFSLISPQKSLSEDNEQPHDCLDQAFKKIIEIRSLPEIKYLYTLDDQYVWLDEFYNKCLKLYPLCCLFKKFYYWESEIREVVSNTPNGSIKHKIRCYNNCLSTYCPESCDPQKTHGDVAEFYNQKGEFMGLSVYMGNGQYCSLPYDGYKKKGLSGVCLPRSRQ